MRLFLSLFSLAMFSALLDGVFITVFGIGIYSLSQSILWAVIGGLVGHKNSIIGLIAYIAIEYFFNNGNLTVYSALLAGITAIQILFAYYIARKSKIKGARKSKGPG